MHTTTLQYNDILIRSYSDLGFYKKATQQKAVHRLARDYRENQLTAQTKFLLDYTVSVFCVISKNETITLTQSKQQVRKERLMQKLAEAERDLRRHILLTYMNHNLKTFKQLLLHSPHCITEATRIITRTKLSPITKRVYLAKIEFAAVFEKILTDLNKLESLYPPDTIFYRTRSFSEFIGGAISQRLAYSYNEITRKLLKEWISKNLYLKLEAAFRNFGLTLPIDFRIDAVSTQYLMDEDCLKAPSSVGWGSKRTMTLEEKKSFARHLQKMLATTHAYGEMLTAIEECIEKAYIAAEALPHFKQLFPHPLYFENYTSIFAQQLNQQNPMAIEIVLSLEDQSYTRKYQEEKSGLKTNV